MSSSLLHGSVFRNVLCFFRREAHVVTHGAFRKGVTHVAPVSTQDVNLKPTDQPLGSKLSRGNGRGHPAGGIRGTAVQVHALGLQSYLRFEVGLGMGARRVQRPSEEVLGGVGIGIAGEEKTAQIRGANTAKRKTHQVKECESLEGALLECNGMRIHVTKHPSQLG